MVSIGDELIDGFHPTFEWANTQVKWLSDVIEFYRERAAIEKEASSKLLNLASKHFTRKASNSAHVSVGSNPSITPGSLENGTLQTWTEVLKQTENIARHRRELCDIFGHQIADQLSGVAARFQDILDQYAEFYTHLEEKRDKLYNKTRRAKHTYDSSCEAMESARARDKNVEKREQERLNAKNAYVISINIANRIKDKFYHDDVPEVLDGIQLVMEMRTAQVNKILTEASELEFETLGQCQDALEEAKQFISKNGPQLDVTMFVEHNKRSHSEPPDFSFEASPIWHEEANIDTSEPARMWLRTRQAEATRAAEQAATLSEGAADELKRAKDDARDPSILSLNATQISPILKEYTSALERLSLLENKRLALEVELETVNAATAGIDMSSIPVTRTKTQRTLFGKKKEVVEVMENSAGPHRSHSFGLTSLLSRTSLDSSGGRSGPNTTARVLYNFTATEPEEMTVLAGQVLMLVQPDDGSGWVTVRSKTESGLVPASYVEVLGVKTAPAPPPQRQRSRRTVIALYDYDAADGSQLTIRTNDRITVLQEDSGNGWTLGELNNERGIFPTNYAK